jgi:hypothetical protein
MLAFRVEIEGHSPLIAGVEDWSVLALHVNAIRGEEHHREGDDLSFSVGGLTTKNAEGISHHFRWARVPLAIGSTVKVTLVETDSPDAVANRYRADKEVQENPYTEVEWREMRRQDYLALKKEFEGEQGA